MTVRQKTNNHAMRTEYGATYGETSAEQNLAQFHAPYFGTGQSFHMDATPSCWLGARSNDDIFPAVADEPNYSGGFIGLDAFGERRLTMGLSGFHATLQTDTAKPAVAFGRDGAAPNSVTSTLNGDIIAKSMSDGLGNEISRRPLFRSGTGYSVYCKFRAGATAGVFMGSEDDSDAAAFVFGLHPDTGQIVCRSRLTGSGLLSPLDYRGKGSPNSVVVVYNAGTMTMWIDGTQVAAEGSKPDMAGLTGDSTMLHVGAYKKTSAGWPFNGYIFALGYLPSPVLSDATQRGKMFDYLATK